MNYHNKLNNALQIVENYITDLKDNIINELLWIFESNISLQHTTELFSTEIINKFGEICDESSDFSDTFENISSIPIVHWERFVLTLMLHRNENIIDKVQ